MSLKPRKVDFESTWDNIRTTIQGVITCGAVGKDIWNERFSDVYKLCTALPQPHGDSLYKNTKKFLEDHVRHLEETIQASREENTLELYHKHWQNYNTGTTYLNSLYGYLNNSYIKKLKFSDADITYGVFAVDADLLLEIGELAKDTWKKLMIDPLKGRLVSLVLQEIKRDRNGHDVNQAVIHSVVTSFVDVSEYEKKTPLELYQQGFEASFLQETGDFYSTRAAHLKADCSCSEYLEKVIQLLDSENLRSRKFLHSTSYDKVTNEVRTKMVADKVDYLQGESTQMVEQEKTSDLKNLYTLFKPLKGCLGDLAYKMELYIRQKGEEAVYGLEHNPMFVEALLTVHKKFSDMTCTYFKNDQLFKSALDKACARVVNDKRSSSRNKSPEMLAKYCDNLLKKSTKGVGDSELDEKLSGSIVIFKYLDDKDIFQQFYSKLLAKRLIYNHSASMDSEESMITRLKEACGYEFTSKLHRMFTDVNVSADLVKSFDDFTASADNSLDVNFSILVFQAGAWPISQQNNVSYHLPQELQKSVTMFEAFYNKRFHGRKLSWMHNLSLVVVKFCYLKKSYMVSMSAFQLACLLPFEKFDVLEFTNIQASTGLPDKELIKQLQTLVDSKIITVSEAGAITETSTFQLNTAYTNKRMKFKITAAVQKESAQEIESTHTAADDNRKMFLQAAIVRIMKARKRIKHNDLINEVFSQARSRFNPSIPMIKKSVENLIEKNYLERVTGKTDEYSYIA